jgi:hypothetical protein
MWQNGVRNLKWEKSGVHDKIRSGRPSVFTDDIVQKLMKTFSLTDV